MSLSYPSTPRAQGSRTPPSPNSTPRPSDLEPRQPPSSEILPQQHQNHSSSPSSSSQEHHHHYHHHYYHYYQQRLGNQPPHHPHGHPPRRPQSAVAEGSLPGQPDSNSTPALAPDRQVGSLRRLSNTHSLPQPQTRHSPTPPYCPRPARSEDASLADCSTTRPDPVLLRPELNKSATHDLDIEQYPVLPSISQSNSPKQARSTYSLSDAGGDDDKTGLSPRQTVRSLLHLALVAAPLSLGIVIYSLCALVWALFTSPLKLCIKSRPGVNEQLVQLLLPPLNVQRRCIYLQAMSPSQSRSSSSSRTPLSSDDAVHNNEAASRVWWPISAGNLLTTHLVAPFVASPLAFGAWIMAAAWMLGAIVSDERAGDDRDERRLAERLVGWWAAWLSWGLARRQGEADHDARQQPERGRHRVRQEMSMTQHGNVGALA